MENVCEMTVLRAKAVIGRFGFGRFCYSTFGKSATAKNHVIDQMLSTKPIALIAAFNKKLNDFTKNEYHDTTISSYRKIVSAGVKVSEFTISIMVNCFGIIKRMDHWLSLLGLTFKTGLRVDDFVITSVLNGYISESKLPAAILFLDRILEFVKRSPNTVMYNILLKAAYNF
ncbi:putative pentatricopeptide repeat-containing protein [Tanacetum coccineum]